MEKTQMNSDGPQVNYVALLIILGIILGFICCVLYGIAHLNIKTTEGVITNRYTEQVGENSRFFVVVRTDDGVNHVMANKNSLWWWKIDSGDIQQNLVIGERYRIKTYWWRVPILDWFPNIVEYQQIYQLE